MFPTKGDNFRTIGTVRDLKTVPASMELIQAYRRASEERQLLLERCERLQQRVVELREELRRECEHRIRFQGLWEDLKRGL